jgi:hypothetical protein
VLYAWAREKKLLLLLLVRLAKQSIVVAQKWIHTWHNRLLWQRGSIAVMFGSAKDVLFAS